MGADIIKIEPPMTGEMLRRPDFPPGGAELLVPDAQCEQEFGNAQPQASERATEIVFKLLEGADVLVENYLDGVMESFGLGYSQIAERFPRLIYASGKGYGSDEPLREARLDG